MEELRLTEIN